MGDKTLARYVAELTLNKECIIKLYGETFFKVKMKIKTGIVVMGNGAENIDVWLIEMHTGSE